jgi:thiamine pyrophosphokinase
MSGGGPQDVARPPAEGEAHRLAVVFLDGDYGDPAFYRDLAGRADIVLAADGGARFLLGIGALPDAVVGDFDSLGAADAERLRAEGVEFLRHPVRKDVTDGELAVDEALRRGAGEVALAGATGALDHTLGHLAILRHLAARGVAARLAAPHLTVTMLLSPAAIALDAAAGTRVSLVPLGGDATVTLVGLDYALDHSVLPADACLGLGNHVAERGASIELHDGIVALLVEHGDESSGELETPAGPG